MFRLYLKYNCGPEFLIMDEMVVYKYKCKMWVGLVLDEAFASPTQVSQSTHQLLFALYLMFILLVFMPFLPLGDFLLLKGAS